MVGVAGAGHACREVLPASSAVSEVVTLGTPYGPVSLAALTTLPEADGLRLLHRLLLRLRRPTSARTPTSAWPAAWSTP